MEKKRVYIVQVSFGDKFATFNKEEAVKLLTILENMKKLWDEGSHWSDNEKFCWLEDLRIEVKSALLDIYPNKEEAKRCKENYEKAKKMGLISKKKEKK